MSTDTRGGRASITVLSRKRHSMDPAIVTTPILGGNGGSQSRAPCKLQDTLQFFFSLDPQQEKKVAGVGVGADLTYHSHVTE